MSASLVSASSQPQPWKLFIFKLDETRAKKQLKMLQLLQLKSQSQSVFCHFALFYIKEMKIQTWCWSVENDQFSDFWGEKFLAVLAKSCSRHSPFVKSFKENTPTSFESCSYCCLDIFRRPLCDSACQRSQINHFKSTSSVMSNMQQGFFWDLDTSQWCVFVGKSMWTFWS